MYHLTQDDFQTISNKIPVLADFKPSGKYLMEDLHQYGGVPAVMKYLLKEWFVTWRLSDSYRKNRCRKSDRWHRIWILKNKKSLCPWTNH